MDRFGFVDGDHRRQTLLRQSGAGVRSGSREEKRVVLNEPQFGVHPRYIVMPVEWKSISDEGAFIGLCAVYGVKDQGSDVIERVPSPTRCASGTRFRFSSNHNIDDIIGVGTVVDTAAGLQIHGRLNLSVAKAREIHALLKQRALDGLSIGYDTLQAVWSGGARILKRIKLWEVSVVAFPMQTLARVESVKSADPYMHGIFSLLTEMRDHLSSRRSENA